MPCCFLLPRPALAGRGSGAIEQTIKPMGAQQSAFDKLKDESAKAADELRASCPAQMAENPVARLDATSDRVHAMVQAIEAVPPEARRLLRLIE
jgi:hypothetical protein